MDFIFPYTSQYTGEQLDQAWNFLHTQVAPPFSTSKTYAVNDFVIYEGLLYQCVTAVTTAGEWNSDNWQVQKVFDNSGYWMINCGIAPTES